MPGWEEEVEELLWKAETHVWAAEISNLFTMLGDGPFEVFEVSDTQRGERRTVRFDLGTVALELDEVHASTAALGTVDLVGGVHGDPTETVVPVRHRDGGWTTLVARTVRCTHN